MHISYLVVTTDFSSSHLRFVICFETKFYGGINGFWHQERMDKIIGLPCNVSMSISNTRKYFVLISNRTKNQKGFLLGSCIWKKEVSVSYSTQQAAQWSTKKYIPSNMSRIQSGAHLEENISKEEIEIYLPASSALVFLPILLLGAEDICRMTQATTHIQSSHFRSSESGLIHNLS